MYFPQLTFTRYIAAFIVLLIHFANVKEVMALPGVSNILTFACTLLSFFFVLAGFVLIVSLNRNNQMPARLPLKLLLIHRFIRLYPFHWLALALMLVIQYIQLTYVPNSGVAPFETHKIFLHAFLLQAWYPDPSFTLIYNFVSWTLCVEILLVVLTPWLYSWMLKQTTPTLVRNVLIIWLGGLLIHQVCIRLGMSVDWGYYWPPFHISEFVVGMGGGFLVCRHLAALKRWDRQIHLLAYVSGTSMILLLSLGLPYLYMNSSIFAVSYLILIISIVLSENWLTRLFCTKPFIYLGKISYGVYILQLPVAALVLRYFHHRVGWPYRYSGLLFLIALTGLAALAYEWIERPIVAYLKSRMNRPVVAEAEPTVAA